uniref:receptor protein-tyrosine kinase n=1 Tax=Apis cerana TaxID=7461 RepID=V9IKL6_APICE
MAIVKCLIVGILLMLEIDRTTQGQLVRLDLDHPDVVVVSIGEKLILRCSLTSNTETTWYKGDEIFKPSSPRIRLMKQSLRFKYIEAEDADSYGCAIGSTERRNVTIRIESLQNDGYQHETENLGGHRTEEETNELEIEARNLPETRSLHLDSENVEVDLDNEKNENETAGEHNNTAPERAPSFNKSVEMPNVVVKPAGNMLRLRCPSFGNPRPNITWYKNNEEPKRTLGTVVMSKWTFRLEDLVPEDSGNYTCVVCNYLGCINRTSKVEIVESVKHRPILTRPPKNTTVLIGGNVTMTCEVLSAAHRHLEWYHGYHTSLSTVNKTNQSFRVEVKAEGAENPEVLKLYNVTEKDEGWYTCIAQNALGETFSSAYLRIVESLEDPGIPITAKPQILVNVLAAVLFIFFAVGVVVVIYIFTV